MRSIDAAYPVQKVNSRGTLEEAVRSFVQEHGITRVDRVMVLHRSSAEHTTRILDLCRRVYPSTSITLVGNPDTLSVIGDHPAVNEHVRISRKDFISIKQCVSVLRRVRQVACDVLILPRMEWMPLDSMTQIYARLCKCRLVIVITEKSENVYNLSEYQREARSAAVSRRVPSRELSCVVCGHQGMADFLKKNSYRLITCPKCGVVFTYPIPSEEELQRLYDESYTPSSTGYQDLVLAERVKRSQATERVSELNRLLPKKGALLDVGSSFGYFLDEARKDDWKVRGLELSATTAQQSRHKLGLEVQQSDLFSAALPDESLEAVTFWDSFEHQRQPERILAEVHRILKPAGIVAMSVPNLASLTFRVARKSWYWLTPPMHLYYFSPGSITNCLRQKGFEPVVVTTHRGDSAPEVPYIVRTLLKRLRLYSILNRLTGTHLDSWLGHLENHKWVMEFDRWLWKRGWGSEIIVYARKAS